jgi:hypothetical protein
VLNAIDADRVAAAGWALGSSPAGLTGVPHSRRALVHELRRGVVVFSGEAADAGPSE